MTRAKTKYGPNRRSYNRLVNILYKTFGLSFLCSRNSYRFVRNFKRWATVWTYSHTHRRTRDDRLHTYVSGQSTERDEAMITVLKDLCKVRGDRSILNTISLIAGDGHTFFAFHCQSNTTVVRENIITHLCSLLSNREMNTRRSTIKSEMMGFD